MLAANLENRHVDAHLSPARDLHLNAWQSAATDTE